VVVTVFSPGRGSRPVEIIRGPIVSALEPTSKRIGAKRDIGYLVLPTFDDMAIPALVESELAALSKAGPLTALVLDVRANGGGFVRACEKVFGIFKKGSMGRFHTRFGDGLSMLGRDSRAYEQFKNIPLVVLVDGESHSAAEILAAALQAERKATVIGSTSAGNTEGVHRVDFPDGSAIYLAFDDFYLRDGSRIGDRGVKPNIAVEGNWYEFPEEQDPVILESLKFLNAL
jgi:carboxyl-terminal processing protease